MTDEPLDAIDGDLAAACHDRHEAWRNLAMRDSPENREAYADACAEVDALLDLRHEWVIAERMVRS
jgi:hypothetical protein